MRSILIAALLTGCTTLSQTGTNAEIDSTSTSADHSQVGESKRSSEALPQFLEPADLYDLLLAELASSRDQFDIAYTLYNRLLEHHQDEELYRRAFTTLQRLPIERQHLSTTTQWRSQYPSIESYRASFIVQTRLGMLDDAIESAQWIAQQAPDFWDVDSLRPWFQQVSSGTSAALIQQIEPLSLDSSWFQVLRLVTLDPNSEQEGIRDQWHQLAQQRFEPIIVNRLLSYELDTNDRIALLEQAIRAFEQTTYFAEELAKLWWDENPDKALEVLLQALDTLSEAPSTLSMAARLALQTDKQDLAEELLNQLLQYESHQEEAWFWLGVIALDNNTQSLAEQHLLKVVHPPFAYYASTRLIDADTALSSLTHFFDQAITHKQQEERFYLIWLSVWQEDINRQQQTLDAWRLHYPESAQPDYNEAFIALAAQDYDQSIELLEQAHVKAPHDPFVLNALAYSLGELNLQLERALSLVEQALNIEPKNIAFIDTQAWILFKLGRLEQAEQILAEVVTQTDNGEILAHYGEVLWTLNKRELAVKIWKKGLSINPDDEYIMKTLQRLDLDADL